ncbi:ribonuclease H-like domain-containing protein [Tanacetum coccineum]
MGTEQENQSYKSYLLSTNSLLSSLFEENAENGMGISIDSPFPLSSTKKHENTLPFHFSTFHSTVPNIPLVNRIPSSALSGKSPYELVFNVEPNISHLKAFGFLCFSTVLNDPDKFSSRSKKSVFIGYSNDKKGYKLYSLESKKCTRRDESNHSESTSEEAASDVDNSAILRKKIVNLRVMAAFTKSLMKCLKPMWNGAWVITDLLVGRKPIRSKWVYKVYINQLVKLKDLRQVRCILSLALHNSWPIYQLDINNAFLYGDLVEDVYMTLPYGYFSKNDIGVCIEVLESGSSLYLTQGKYCLELLSEFGLLACKPCGAHIESKKGVVKTSKAKVTDIDNPLTGIISYQKLVGKMIYLTYTRHDISYDVHVHSNELNLRVYVDSDKAKCKVTRKSITGYAVFMGRNLVS